MKRIGNLYEKIYDIENLKLAHKQARRGKSFYTEVKLIDENEDEYDLKVKDSWSLFRVEDRGIDFVGYVFRHDSIRLRKSIAHSIKKTSSKIRWRVNNDMELNRHLYFSFNSLKGWLKHSHSGWLKIRYFDIIEDHVQDYHDRFLVKHKEV